MTKPDCNNKHLSYTITNHKPLVGCALGLSRYVLPVFILSNPDESVEVDYV